MGSRGAYGFRINGIDKIQYNHFDSYPEGLGADVLKTLRRLVKNTGIPELKRQAAALRVIDDKTPPTAEDVAALKEWTDLSVSGQSTSDWYCLTRSMQGDIEAHLKSGYIGDAVEFLMDSLFCEFAYLINFDDGMFEFYRGFNKKADAAGRYAKLQRPLRPNEITCEYFGVRLVRAWPLDKLPRNYPKYREEES